MVGWVLKTHNRTRSSSQASERVWAMAIQFTGTVNKVRMFHSFSLPKETEPDQFVDDTLFQLAKNK